MMIKLSVVAVTIAVLCAASASAAGSDWNAGLGAGEAILQGSLRDKLDDSARIDAHVERRTSDLGLLPEPAWVGIEGAYDLGHKLKGLPAILPETKIQFVQATPYVRAGITRDGTEFYGILGAGYYRQLAKTITVTQGALSVSTTIEGVDHFGINAGAGVQHWFDRVAVGADLRYHHVFDSGDDIRAFVPSVRVSRAF